MNLELQDVIVNLRTLSTRKVRGHSLNILAALFSRCIPPSRAGNSHNPVFAAKRRQIWRSQGSKQLFCGFLFSPGVADCSRVRDCAAWREHPLLHHPATFRVSFLLQHRSGVWGETQELPVHYHHLGM